MSARHESYTTNFLFRSSHCLFLMVSWYLCNKVVLTLTISWVLPHLYFVANFLNLCYAIWFEPWYNIVQYYFVMEVQVYVLFQVSKPLLCFLDAFHICMWLGMSQRCAQFTQDDGCNCLSPLQVRDYKISKFPFPSFSCKSNR